MAADPASYRAIALQTRCQAINRCTDRDDARSQMLATIARVGRQIRAAKTFFGPTRHWVGWPP